MPTKQGGILLKNSINSLRRSCRAMTTLPCPSTPCTWNTFFAISMPIVVACMWTTPSCDSFSNDHPLAHSMPGAGVVHLIKTLRSMVASGTDGLPNELKWLLFSAALPSAADALAACRTGRGGPGTDMRGNPGFGQLQPVADFAALVRSSAGGTLPSVGLPLKER